MNITERRMQIYDLVSRKERVEISELANYFHVSTMTIRRDLRLLEKQGAIHTNYGEAHLNRQFVHEPGFNAKSEQNIHQKRLIGSRAAQFIQDGDTIITDCGTTVLQMLYFLEGKRVTVITNSWPSARIAGINPRIKLIMAPGEYCETTSGMAGPLTIEFFSRIHADKVFLGGHGFSLEDGVTEPDIEYNAKKTMMAAGKQRFLLADSSKWGKTHLMKYANLEEFDYIITDSDYTDETKETLLRSCKDIIFAQSCDSTTDGQEEGICENEEQI